MLSPGGRWLLSAGVLRPPPGPSGPKASPLPPVVTGLMGGPSGSTFFKRFLISEMDQIVGQGGKVFALQLWSIETGKIVTTYEGHRADILCLAISPNELFALSGAEDGTVRVWGLPP